MDFKICIPSFNRPKFKTLQWLNSEGVDKSDIVLFLHTPLQVYKYSKSQNLEGVKIWVTGAKCMRDQRNFIMEKMFPRKFVFLDDDVTGIHKFYREGKTGRVQKVNFIEIVQSMFRIARHKKCKVWGTSCYRNAHFSLKLPPWQFDKFFRINLTGVDGYRTKLEVEIGTDQQLGLSAIRDKVGLMRFNYVGLDISLGVEGAESKGGIGRLRYLYNGTTLRRIAQNFLPFLGRKKLVQFGDRSLIKSLDGKFIHRCKWCKAGFWNELSWDVHKNFPCPEKQIGGIQ